MRRLAFTLVLIGIINFVSYVIIAMSLGGNAVSGKAEGNKFYLREHGRYTEVSRLVYDYSRYHTYSVWITQPLAMFGVYLLYRQSKKQKAADPLLSR
jgi:hypothetical protein